MKNIIFIHKKIKNKGDSMKNIKKAIFAGGCFWCMVKPFFKYDGVLDVIVGYTGGEVKNPSYEQVCNGGTGHYEAVEITYDEDIITYEELVDTFFKSIDPTDNEGQFFDKGESYKTVIFYSDEAQKDIAIKYKENLEKSNRFDKPIATAIKPAKVFYKAEDYHQGYYIKNPLRYKAYYKGSGREHFLESVWRTSKNEKEKLKNSLNRLQYIVTQENGTEPPFDNEYDNHFEDGIYVDIISKKPLFSSKDKFKCSCGWPAFSKPINGGYVKEKEDLSHGMMRIEVRSASSNAHLGHVFDDGPKELGGLRYCINSAALEFIPRDKIDELGYSRYKKYV